MVKYIVIALLSLNFIFLSPARADAPAVVSAKHEERENFARHFAQQVLAIIQDPKKTYGDRKDVLRNAFSNSVDIDWIAHFVIGRGWNAASESQRSRYTALYRTYLTETYVANFAENPDKRIRDIRINAVADGEEDRFTVNTDMMLADNEDLKVNYLVREHEGSYQVLDIVIENVSLIMTHRAEFAQLAARGGIDGVIATLEDKNRKPITLSMR